MKTTKYLRLLLGIKLQRALEDRPPLPNLHSLQVGPPPHEEERHPRVHLVCEPQGHQVPADDRGDHEVQQGSSGGD